MNENTRDERIERALYGMTTDEKIAQLNAVWVYELLDKDGKLSPKKMENLLGNGIGQITRIGGASNLPPEQSATLANEIQKFLIEKTGPKIPAIVHEECLNGYMAKGATIFPQMIGIASSWNSDLVISIASTIREQMRSVGAHQGLAPVLDIARDPRWGRTEETFGEDVYIVSLMATKYIKGLQGRNLRSGILATAKHFVAYSFSEGGMNWAPVHISERELREVFLRPFEIAVKEAKVRSVMNAYHEIDGIPCGASKKILNDILRKEWIFDGIVVSDYFAIDMLGTYHHVAADKEKAAKMALEAGIDVELPSKDCYNLPLKKVLEKGLISEKVIDESVKRILRVKFELGLFDNPYVEPRRASKLFDIPKQRKLARQAARESIVLLKNDNDFLPLNKNVNSIAIIGPNANSKRNLLSDYSYPSHIENLIEMAQGEGAFDTPAPENVNMDKSSIPIISVLEGIRNKVFPTTTINYAKGCDVLDNSKKGFEEAIQAAKKSEVAIVVVGDKSGLTLSCTTGESRDRVSLNLPGVQEDLVRAVCKTGTPVVLVLVNGRPLSIKWAVEHVPAIIEAWLPGEEGGNAIADVIFGDYNPSGKLPISFPRTVGQVPVYYNHKPSGGHSSWHEDYVEESSKPLFSFGYGLSYTNFEYSNLVISSIKLEHPSEIEISFDLKNVGKMKGAEIPQLYINDVYSSVTRPVKELKGFKKVFLNPGEKKRVIFKLFTDQLAFYDVNMNLIVESGFFKVMVGSSSENIELEDEFEIIGKTQKIDSIEHFFSTAKIE